MPSFHCQPACNQAAAGPIANHSAAAIATVAAATFSANASQPGCGR